MCLAVPMEVRAVSDNGMATVLMGGVEREISLVMTPEAQVGDYVLVHTGYAINVIDAVEAKETLRMFAAMGIGEDGEPLEVIEEGEQRGDDAALG